MTIIVFFYYQCTWCGCMWWNCGCWVSGDTSLREVDYFLPWCLQLLYTLPEGFIGLTLYSLFYSLVGHVTADNVFFLIVGPYFPLALAHDNDKRKFIIGSKFYFWSVVHWLEMVIKFSPRSHGVRGFSRNYSITVSGIIGDPRNFTLNVSTYVIATNRTSIFLVFLWWVLMPVKSVPAVSFLHSQHSVVVWMDVGSWSPSRYPVHLMHLFW